MGDAGTLPVNEVYISKVLGLKEGMDKIGKALTSHVKWLQGELDKSGGKMTYALTAYKPALARQVHGILQSKCKDLMSGPAEVPTELNTLLGDIFGAQHWSQAERHCNLGLTPYGLPEVRMLLSGSYMYVGVHCSKRNDDTANSTRSKIEYTLTSQGFKLCLETAKVEGSGFWLVHDEEHSCVRIPPNHVVFTCGMHSK